MVKLCIQRPIYTCGRPAQAKGWSFSYAHKDAVLRVFMFHGILIKCKENRGVSN
ncbi:hypothetical protein BPJM79_10844 [Bacillus pumilus]